MSFMPGSGAVGAANYQGRTKIVRARYDFDEDGGAVGAITLRGPSVPSGAYVTDCYVIVHTILDSAGDGATVSIGLEAATDLRAAAVVGTAPSLGATGIKRSALVTGASAPLTLTAARSVVATVAVEALTTGAFDVVVEYFEVAA
jgi:hypothetical protein